MGNSLKDSIDLLEIVITGGPCAGKTESLKALKEVLEDEGYKVLTCEEMASFLIRQNAVPIANGKGNIKIENFQWEIYKGQKTHEEMMRDIAELLETDRVAILYDRGILDNRAYISHAIFQTFLDRAGSSVEEEIKYYDLILHLVSVAFDKEDAYEQNETRFESLAKAKEVELNTREAWGDLPNKLMFFNDCDFEEKKRRVANAVLKHVETRTKSVLLRDCPLSNIVDLTREGKAKMRRVKSHREKEESYIIEMEGHSYKLGIAHGGVLSLSMSNKTQVPEWVGTYDIFEKPLALELTKRAA